MLLRLHRRDGEPFSDLLVRNGLARVYSVRTPLYVGRDSRTYLGHLTKLEAQARAERLGG